MKRLNLKRSKSSKPKTNSEFHDEPTPQDEMDLCLRQIEDKTECLEENNQDLQECLQYVHHKITRTHSLKDTNVMLRRTNFDIMTDKEREPSWREMKYILKTKDLSKETLQLMEERVFFNRKGGMVSKCHSFEEADLGLLRTH